jgi:hypothetical protein
MDKIEALLNEAAKLYQETHGAYFVLTASNDGKFWKLSIPSIQGTFKGSVQDVLIDYIYYVANNRELAGKNLKSKKYKLF